MPLRDSEHRRCNKLNCLAPGDPLPTGIAIAFWARSFKWMCQPVRVIYQLGRGPTLRTERLAGGMSGVRFDFGEAAIFNARDVTAVCNAKSTIALDPLCGVLIPSSSRSGAGHGFANLPLLAAYAGGFDNWPPFFDLSPLQLIECLRRLLIARWNLLP